MKKILLLVLLGVYVNGNSQFVDFIPSIQSPNSIVKYGNDFYISSFLDEKVYKFDTSNSLSNIYSTNSTTNHTIGPQNLMIDTDQMYVSINGGSSSSRIDKLNLSNNPSTSTTVFNGTGGPIVKYGNFLIIGDFPNSIIYKYNLLTSVTSTLLTGIKPSYFSLKNNELFITSNSSNNVQKINLDSLNPIPTTLVSSLNHAAGICYDSNYFYVANSNTSRINIYDINSWNYIGFYNLPTNSFPNGISILDNYMYACLTSANKVVRLNLTLNLQQIQKKSENILLFPNPTKNFITIQNPEKSTESFDYKILDLTGRVVKSGNSKFNEQINIESLTSGNYFVQIQTDRNENFTQKIIKN